MCTFRPVACHAHCTRMGIWTSLSQTEVIIISASCGGALLLILIVLAVLYRRYHTAKARLVHELGGNPGKAFALGIRQYTHPTQTPSIHETPTS